MPRCLHCKEKFVKKYFVQPYCMAKDECIIAFNEYVKQKTWKVKKKVMKIDTHSKEHKKALQDEINKLSRMIDIVFDFKCIDCGKEYGKQTDAAHYHSRGANCSLRYNLHNLHSASSQCNLWSDTHKEGYKTGLINRYGKTYFDMVESLPLKYPEIHLSNVEIVEKLAIVRKLIRTFHTYKFATAIEGRTIFNNILGIYKQ